MLIEAGVFYPDLTQAQVDELINDLLVNMTDFSRIACLDGRMHGVNTSCDVCDLEVNDCVRLALISGLINAQNTVESKLGYNLTRRYHTETRIWSGASVLQTRWPGLSEMNVQKAYANRENFSISPYIQEGITVEEVDGKCVATFSATLVKNPVHAMIRDEDGSFYPTTGNPSRSGGNWQMALMAKNIQPPCEGHTFDVQHCQYMILEADRNATPVYTGTNQIIPVARPTESIGGGNYRYWFHVWELIDPAFITDGADLEAGQFWKLLTSIDLIDVEEEPLYASVRLLDQCSEYSTYTDSEEETRVEMEIINAEMGAVEIIYDDCHCPCCQQALMRCRCEHPVRLTFGYRTDPAVLNIPIDLGSVQEAIANLVAAELPLSTCNCPTPKTGFIAAAQKPYTDWRINPLTGNEHEIFKYGSLHGQLVFSERMKRVKQHYRLVRA